MLGGFTRHRGSTDARLIDVHLLAGRRLVARRTAMSKLASSRASSGLFRWSRLLACCQIGILLTTCGATQADPKLHQRIDQLIVANRVGPALEVVDDAEFLRRVYLDLHGAIPTSEVVRNFLADDATDKRAQTIKRLLAEEQFTQHMVNVFDLMLMERRPAPHVQVDQWREFLADALAPGKGLDELFRQILLSDGASAENRGPARFILDREANPHALTRDIGRIYFGRDFQCAQCHDHPLIDDYYQHDYYGLLAFLHRSYLKKGKDKQMTLAEKPTGEANFSSVFDEDAVRHLAIPKLPTQAPSDQASIVTDTGATDSPAATASSRRTALAEAATDPTTKAFSQNLANRLWAHMLGRGLVHPVDLFHAENPPSNPRLLDLLAEQLVACQFDLRFMLGQIANSQAYQRSIDFPEPLTIADDLEQLRPGVTAEEARLSELADQSRQAVSVAVDQLREATATLAAQNDKRTEKTEQRQSLQKEYAKVAKQLKSLQADATKKLAQHDKVAAVVKSARVAAEALPDDETLITATQSLEKRLSQLAAAHAKQLDLVEANKKQLDALAQQRQEIDQALESTLTRLADQEAEIATICRRLESERKRYAKDAALASEAKDRLDSVDLLVAYASAIRQSEHVQRELTNLDASLRGDREQFALLAARTTALHESIDEAQNNLLQFWESKGLIGVLKPLTAEQLARSWLTATGMIDQFKFDADAAWNKEQEKKKQEAENAKPAEAQPLGETPADQTDQELTGEADDQTATATTPTAEELEKEKEQFVAAKLNEKVVPQVRRLVTLFGGEPGQPQDEFHATVDQALFMANAGTLQSWLAQRSQNLTGKLMKIKEDRALVEELYLAILGRMPAPSESQAIITMLQADEKQRRDRVIEAAWALATSAEFRFNH